MSIDDVKEIYHSMSVYLLRTFKIYFMQNILALKKWSLRDRQELWQYYIKALEARIHISIDMELEGKCSRIKVQGCNDNQFQDVCYLRAAKSRCKRLPF